MCPGGNMKSNSPYYLTVKEFKLYPNKAQKEILDKEFEFFNNYKKFLFAKADEYEKRKGIRMKFKDAKDFGFHLKTKILSLNRDYSDYYFNDHFEHAAEILGIQRIRSSKNHDQFKQPMYSSVTKSSIKISNLNFDERHLLFKENCAIRIRPDYDSNDRFHFFNICKCNDEYKLVGVAFKRTSFIAKSKQACGLDFGYKNFLTIFDTKGEIQQINLVDQKIDKYLKEYFKTKKILKHILEKNGNNPQTNNCKKLATKITRLNDRIYRIRTNQYNRLAKLLVLNYDYIAIEGLDTSEIGKRCEMRVQAFKYRYASFKTILTNQAKKYGKTVYVVDRFFPSSQICSNCGLVHKEMDDYTKYQDRIVCSCGNEMDRDANAAKNLLSKMITDLDIAHLFSKTKKVAHAESINEGNLLFDVNNA